MGFESSEESGTKSDNQAVWHFILIILFQKNLIPVWLMIPNYNIWNKKKIYEIPKQKIYLDLNCPIIICYLDVV